MSLDSIRSEIYLLLSEGFKKPTASFCKELGELVRFLRQSLADLNYPISSELYRQWPQMAGCLSHFEKEYIQSFVFPVESRVVPVESVYRRWTYDTTGNVPFAAEKGFLLSDHALHLRALYQAFGISVPDEFQSMPDHICLELEFAAFLLNQNMPGRLAVFIREHLSWLEDLSREARTANIPLYYRQLIDLTAQFVACEQQYWESVKA